MTDSQDEAATMAALGRCLARAMGESAGWVAHLAGVDPQSVTSRAALARLPVLRKSDLLDLQAAAPPLGGLNLTQPGDMARLFLSPGPIHEPEGRGEDWWGAAPALRAAGVRAGDIVLNTFSYHLTPGGFMFDGGARALGCAVIPAGPSAPADQVAAIRQYHPRVYVGIPDFLKILIEKLDEARVENPISLGILSGGALPPSLQDWFSGRGVTVRQSYGTADLGIVAYEDGGPGMRFGSNVIPEVVSPGTGTPLPDGDVGELLVTRVNPDYPLFRFATGDMTSLIPGDPLRMSGWKGRADQATKVKGMFVRPEQIAALARALPGLGRLRLVVTREEERDRMTLLAEHPDAGVAAQLTDLLREHTKLGGEVRIVEPGSLPNDGRFIYDERE